MTYDWVPQIIIGIVLAIVGAKLSLNFPIANLVRLALVVIGFAILVWGRSRAYAQFSVSISR